MIDPSARREASISVAELVFDDGTTVALSPSDVVLVVGPNNAGKSVTLRGIRDKLPNPQNSARVLKSLKVVRHGSIEQLLNWLKSRVLYSHDPVSGTSNYQIAGIHFSEADIRGTWENSSVPLGALANLFSRLLSADQRLQISNPTEQFAFLSQTPIHPLHFLYLDDRLEIELSEKFKKAFNVDLILQRTGGTELMLHIGKRPAVNPGEDRLSYDYVKRLGILPLLNQQGDGMRSYAGVLLASSVGQESVLLIDEPEAFLHPPQARLLGRSLVQDRKQQCQIFLATHSTDILRGLLDTESSDVRVIRIQRSGNTNSIHVLDNQRIKELWNDPLLRYSNILDGLFHELVIVGEADSDCRFYAAVLDAALSTISGVKCPDLMFTHCGGKHRLPVVVRALREVNVPVRAVADFDVLSEKGLLAAIVEAFGATWAPLEKDWKILKTEIEKKKPELSVFQVKNEITRIFNEAGSGPLAKHHREQINSALKKSSPWENAKIGGRSFVPSGNAYQACDRLLQALRQIGLFVVDVGEAEGFARSVGGHGPEWVNRVLLKSLATDSELAPARKFVLELIS